MSTCNFGVCVPQDGRTFDEMRRLALKCEDLHFSSFWLFDHLHSFPQPDKDPFMECWVTLSALAEITKEIRLGPLVTNVQYRHPALLAKMATTIDHVSGGRFEFGIGAGGTGRSEWSQKMGFGAEYEAYGMDFPSNATVRIERLREAVQIIKRLWVEPRVSFRGEHYRLTDASCYPKPLQKPHPPVWIGGTGERHLLDVVAQEADGCNFAWDLSAQEYRRRLAVLGEYCNRQGRSLDSLRKSLLTACVMAKSADDVSGLLREVMKPYERIGGYVPYAFRASALTGTIDECIRKFNEFKEAGVTDFILVFPEFETERWLTQFAELVMPSFSHA
jgi:alkanesulfonate monooxygenase SsuD/methylene tetrahydromethanopterin reductase-like flavin-dependent oxidoreductase (luciferase family)